MRRARTNAGAGQRSGSRFQYNPNEQVRAERARRAHASSTRGTYQSDDEVEDAFDTLLRRNHSDSFREFLDSVHEWWEEKGFLTERQWSALKNAMEKRR